MMRVAEVWGWALVLLMLSGCVADPRRARDDDLADAAMESDGQMTQPVPDAELMAPDAQAQRPDLGPPDAALPPPPGFCAEDPAAVQVVLTDGFEHLEPSLLGDRLVVHRNQDLIPGLADEGGRAFDQLQATRVMGADHNAVLATDVFQANVARPRLVHMRAGAEPQVIAELNDAPRGPFAIQSPWPVGPDYAAWYESDVIWHWDNDRILEVGRGQQLHDATRSHVVFVSVEDTGAELYVAEVRPPDGAPEPFLLRIPTQRPTRAAFNDRGLYFIDDGGVGLVTWASIDARAPNPEVVRVLEGTNCEHLDAQGGLAVFTCRSIEGGSQVHLHGPDDLQPRRMLHAVVADAVTDGVGVVWAGYEAEGAWCNNFDIGAIYWIPDVRQPDQQVLRLASAGSGCLCCGAWWPSMRLALNETFIAWRYWVDEGGEPGPEPMGSAIGYVRRGDLCE